MPSFESPLTLRVAQALVRMLGGLTAIALPREISDFNVNQRYMFRLVVILCACLSLTEFDVPASVALLAIYVMLCELLDWQFPDEEGEQVAIAKDAGKLPSNKQSAWQWKAISSLVQ